jgi:exosortase
VQPIKLRSFQIETKSQNNLWLFLKVAVIASLTIALFSNDLFIVFNDALVNEATNYVLLIPFILVYLFYRKRKTLKAVTPLETTGQTTWVRHVPLAIGSILAATAILLYWFGSYTFTPIEYHMLALPVFVTGLVLIFFNTQTLRQAAFPILFLAFLIPPPTEILYTVGGTLSQLSSVVANGVVSLVGIPTRLTSEYGNPIIDLTRPDGTQIQFSVDIACSGIYSLIAFVVFAVLVAYIMHGKLWKKIALISLGIPVIYAFNVIRIITLLAIGYQVGEGLALQIFHLLGGWILIFTGTLLLFLISEKILKAKIFEKHSLKCSQCELTKQKGQNSCLECGRLLNPPKIRIRRSDVIKILAAVTIVTALLSIQAPVFALAKAPTEIFYTTPTGQQTTAEIFPSIPGYLDASFLYRDTNFEELAKTDLALAYVYNPTNESAETIFISFEVASSTSLLHRWETCLVNYPLQQGWKPKVTQIELSDIEISTNPPILGRFFAFQNNPDENNQAVLYWYESSVFTLNSTSQQKYVKLSLITYPESTEQLPEIKNQMISVAKAIVTHWEPIKVWSSITFFISQNGATLSAATSIILVLILFFNKIEDSKQRHSNQKIYKKLSAENQQLVDVIQQAEYNNKLTLNAIKEAYQKATGEELDEVQLQKKLQDLEKTGLIENQIATNEDVPVSVWKAQMPQSIFKKIASNP